MTSGRWIVEVSGACIASGVCLGTAPSYFVRGEDGRTHAVTADVEADDLLLDVTASCPVEAITVHDAGTGERVEP